MLFQEGAQLGSVKEVIINPANGNFLGFAVKAMGKEMVVPTNEIKMIGSGFVMVRDFNSITDPKDVVRIKETLDFGAKILGEGVQTECGQKLGKVNNATLNLKTMALDKLYVSGKLSIRVIAKELLISAEKIVEIKKDLIIVSDDFAKVRKPRVVPVPMPD